MKNFALITLVLASFNTDAALVKLDWNTTASFSNTVGLLSGDAVNLSFVFDVNSSNLQNVNLNISNFVNYSFTLFDGRSVTFDLAEPGNIIDFGYASNNFFSFDSAGSLTSVDRFFIFDNSVSSNVFAWNGIGAGLFNNGGNCFSCFSPFRFDVNNVSSGLSPSSWEVTTVSEPSTIALFGLGVLGFGAWRRRLSKNST